MKQDPGVRRYHHPAGALKPRNRVLRKGTPRRAVARTRKGRQPAVACGKGAEHERLTSPSAPHPSLHHPPPISRPASHPGVQAPGGQRAGQACRGGGLGGRVPALSLWVSSRSCDTHAPSVTASGGGQDGLWIPTGQRDCISEGTARDEPHFRIRPFKQTLLYGCW